MLLSENHPIYTTSNEVHQISKLLEPLGISYFSYHRSYNTGERTYLFTMPELDCRYFKEGHYLTGRTEHKPVIYHDQILLWSTIPNQQIFNALPRSVGIDHGMYIIKPSNDYCDFFSFATNKGNDKIINTYLTKLDIFKSFTDYFLDQASDLIKIVNQHKIILPFNKKKIASDDKYLDLELTSSLLSGLKSKKMPLTQRQVECSLLLIQGNSSKQIAEKLKLSPRTVEYYINNIKSKLNCSNRIELITKLSRELTN